MQPQATPHDSLSRILLIPGYWLGGWAWDRVASRLATLGRAVEAITLPGLDATDADRSTLRFSDHVAYVLERVRASTTPCVLVAHSGAGAVVTAVADAAPDALRRVIYVDSGPASDGATPRPDLTSNDAELPFPGFAALASEGVSIEGISERDRAGVQSRAVPHPAGTVREPVRLRDPHRNEIPVTLVCCSIPGAAVQELAASGAPMFAAIAELADLTVVDLPTGHWPMFSRPDDLADVIAQETARV